MTKKLLTPVIFLLIGVIVAAGAMFALGSPLMNLGSWTGKTTSKSTEVITAVTRTEEVALVTLGIEGISERRTEAGKVLFLNIPNSRAKYLRYSFDAKLGIDGASVDIIDNKDGSFVITVPKFIFIGMNNQEFEIAVQDNDVLSWTTEEIKDTDLINEVFGDETKKQYLEKNNELLRDQATSFYTNIVTAIDPEATLTFDFAD